MRVIAASDDNGILLPFVLEHKDNTRAIISMTTMR
jgi:hypothetical protein